ncbi:phosphonoacetaldehyde hydrolase [Marinobacterium sediminicola]|uniref:Phosphonoacetaldehyde hydrolase n=1 Tax=Marinobacterium sediminicola TaxID=518898 RepID=A0ABY1RYV1_9GAMM|nr:phosphonoacetaldehyde hydrolase [Marinobacterium sediminicola]ULG68118.1 phosphonoacetaldehyde hydrolase [Marinobacterium sediminicola]SMR73369.1 phosphonoacetaldehyde hydrolase [Marinobacterium sediminicola]
MTLNYQFERRYTGPIEAVIMDWAGTTVDFGSMAPIRAFQRLFAEEGVPISEAEARGPMGTEKREHIRQLCAHPRIRDAWQEAKGALPSEADIDRMYDDFVPLQIDAIAQTADLIPGLIDALEWMRSNRIRIGGNTGYAASMIEGLLARAAEQGYAPDSNVCATEVPKGRPYPHMTLKNAMDLGVQHLCACVKIDDTLTGIEEGLNAGMWTIGVAVSGNEVGMSLDEWLALSEAEQEVRRAGAYQRMAASGAHYVIDSIADVVPCLEEIAARLAMGEKP